MSQINKRKQEINEKNWDEYFQNKKENEYLKQEISHKKQAIEVLKSQIKGLKELEEYKELKGEKSSKPFLFKSSNEDFANKFLVFEEEIIRSLQPVRFDLKKFLRDITSIPKASPSLLEILNAKIYDENIEKISTETLGIIEKFIEYLILILQEINISFPVTSGKRFIFGLRNLDELSADPSEIYLMIKKLFEENSIILSKKDIVIANSLCDLFVFVVTFKQNLTQKLSTFFEDNDLSFQNYELDSIPDLIYYHLNYVVDFSPNFKDLIDLFIESFNGINIPNSNEKLTEIINSSRREALGKTIHCISKRLLKENYQNKLTQEFAQHKETPKQSIMDEMEQANEYLKEYLNPLDLQYILFLIDVNYCGDEIDSLSPSLLNLFDSFGLSIHLLKLAISREIKQTQSIQYFFRSATFCSKLISDFSFSVGINYLISTLKPVVMEMSQVKTSFEVDSYLTDDCESGQKNLSEYFFKITNSIFESVPNIPFYFREIANHIKTEMLKRFPEDALLGIGSYILHRFFCPAIVSPKLYNIVDYNLNEQISRGLLLISSSLANLASGKLFGVNREYMNFMNKNIEKQHEKLNQFFESVSFVEDQETQYISIDNNRFIVYISSIYRKSNQNNQISKNEDQKEKFAIFLDLLIPNEKKPQTSFNKKKIFQMETVYQNLEQIVFDFQESNSILSKLNEKLKEIQQIKSSPSHLSNLLSEPQKKIRKKPTLFCNQNLISKWAALWEQKPELEGWLSSFAIKNQKKIKRAKRYLVFKKNIIAVFESNVENSVPLHVIIIDNSTKINQEKSSKFHKKKRLSIFRKGEEEIECWLTFDSDETYQNWFSILHRARKKFTKSNQKI
eukprot:Anaeramoba_ignava/c21117_g2_i1.p1 GENE.c21117_g2_i1~~c21117_g2_i1.p1  ORF type:complete len:849 (+),score=309.57 c21117_g2_i1:365-2911(+)